MGWRLKKNSSNKCVDQYVFLTIVKKKSNKIHRIWLQKLSSPNDVYTGQGNWKTGPHTASGLRDDVHWNLLCARTHNHIGRCFGRDARGVVCACIPSPEFSARAPTRITRGHGSRELCTSVIFVGKSQSRRAVEGAMYRVRECDQLRQHCFDQRLKLSPKHTHTHTSHT